MKTLHQYSRPIAKIMTMSTLFVFLVFACSKNSKDPSTGLSFCNTVDWSSSLGLSGYFTGSVANGQFGLSAVDIKDNGKDTFLAYHRTNNTSQILNDQSGITYTYDQDKLVKIEQGNGTGKITFTFDVSSHLTQTHVQNTDNTGTSELILTYTYDTNGDPVKIIGHAVTISNGETSIGDYDITADYLTDKTNFLPLIPEIVPFTPYFAYSWYLSQHLINKWQIKITVTPSTGPVTTINVTEQYKYTYDNDGRVATMSHSANNVFTFTYSGCN
jgi:hypothetical protein